MNNRALRFLSFGLGALLLFHGIDKVMNGTEFIEKMLVGLKVPYSEYVQYGVYIGEVLAPLLLIFGQYIRISGAIIAFDMLVAIFLVHQNTLFTLGEHGAWSIELPMLYLVAGVTLALWDREKKSK
ncbi:MAG: GntR family transcriptional regulator [Sulfurovum sp.]|nr:MAG: GntR family transcriptional regulator [Sulfurovum sp.]